MLPDCSHRKDTECGIASLLAKQSTSNVVVTEKTCAACMASEQPQSVNRVTCGVAFASLQKEGGYKPNEHGYLSTCLGVTIAYGVGSVFKRKLSWFVKPSETCDCESRASVMNVWGPDKCEEEIETILDWCEEAAKEQGLLFIRWGVRIMLRSAIEEVRRNV